MMKRIFLLITFLGAVMLQVQGQKYGHLNFGNLIASLPETKAADSELEAFQKQLIAKGEEMAAKFQENYAKFAKEVQGGTLPPKDQQSSQEALQKEQQEIVNYEQQITQELEKKRSELLKPIVEKAEKAIQEVAKENGFTMIFDTSIFNALLYVKETDDVMPLVKAKLGIQ